MLVDLPNTKDPKECEFFRSVTKALAIIRRGLAATAAGGAGAINVWRDDSGQLRGELFVRQSLVESAVFGTVVSARRFIAQWLLKINPQ